MANSSNSKAWQPFLQVPSFYHVVFVFSCVWQCDDFCTDTGYYEYYYYRGPSDQHESSLVHSHCTLQDHIFIFIFHSHFSSVGSPKRKALLCFFCMLSRFGIFQQPFNHNGIKLWAFCQGRLKAARAMSCTSSPASRRALACKDSIMSWSSEPFGISWMLQGVNGSDITCPGTYNQTTGYDSLWLTCLILARWNQ